MRKLLFRDERHQEVGKLIKDLWDLRRELMKKLEKETNVKPSLKIQTVKTKADIPTNRGNRKAQKGYIDSGSVIDTTQGCIGSGPQVLTTQGCIGSGPKRHIP